MTEERNIYVRSAKQISMQEPLSEAWMDAPKDNAGESYVRSADPVFRDYLSPIESRRLGRLLKRALVTSTCALKEAGIDHPDAIVTGTGLGCVEDTEAFLHALCTDGESLLKPTHFMQSTHNTIGSLIAIHTKTRGYNATYSHKSVSFDSALLDAVLQLRLGYIRNALVGSHDEVTPSYFTLLRRIGYVGQPGQTPCGEVSAAIAVDCDDSRGDALCRLAGIDMLYRPSAEQAAKCVETLTKGKPVDGAVVGVNGLETNDRPYRELLRGLLPKTPAVRHKKLFGECYSASALAVYTAAQCLHKGKVPGSLTDNGSEIKNPRRLLAINHSDGKEYSFILLERCGG